MWDLITAGIFSSWFLYVFNGFALATSQTVFDSLAMASAKDNSWRVSVSDDWNVLGPFPIHAREQHFLSPSFPLNLSKSIDFQAQWPSAYADGGSVSWSHASSIHGSLAVTFPYIRWASLRATEGWAALQHHSVLRTTLTVFPPSNKAIESGLPPRLLVSLSQGSFFAIRPISSNIEDFIPRWYTGNIYQMDAASPQCVDLPVEPSIAEPTTYELFVSGDYEIRLFGDPLTARNSDVPELQINLSIAIEEPTSDIVLQDSHHVVPDFIDGWAFGDALGVGLRSVESSWVVKEAHAVPEIAAVIDVHLLQDTPVFPSQTRILPLRVSQSGPFLGSDIRLTIVAMSQDSTRHISVTLPVNHSKSWTQEDFSPIHATFFFATSMPTAFLAIPPTHENAERILPPILALHGAGVGVAHLPLWASAVPRQKNSWIIVPVGRTSWGLDWHGLSAQEALATVAVLHDILQIRRDWHAWKTERNSRVLLIGHSNGGQGAWHIASRFPDRIIGALPAAGYIKSQSYVSLVQSRSAHYIDPAIRAILETAFTADDNDLFISNLVDTPILAIHGGDDENVPVWHTRELVSVLKTWRANANVKYQEDEGQPHWYPSHLFLNDSVKDFLNTTLQNTLVTTNTLLKPFTLTVAIPADSGSLHGFKIEALLIPGRLGRLTVQPAGDEVVVKTSNVRTFAIRYGSGSPVVAGKTVLVDGQAVNIGHLTTTSVYLSKRRGDWEISVHTSGTLKTSTGRLSNILTTSAPMGVVIPDNPSTSALLTARRLAHDLDLYHKLDVSILYASEAAERLQESSLGKGNLIIVGGVENLFGKTLLGGRKTAFSYDQSSRLQLNGRAVDEGSAALFLHPHPENYEGLVLFMHGQTEDALERLSRLFPIRTGITIPDWIVLGNVADTIGTGGVEGAGVWGHEWTWNEALSSF